MGRVLRHLKVIDEALEMKLHDVLTPPVKNWAGAQTGQIRPSADCPF